MNLEQIANLGEALGGLAVVTSLIYLIIELRRNTRSIRANSAWNADIGLATMNEGIAQNPQLAELCLRAINPQTTSTDLTPEEYAQVVFLSRAVFQKYQAQWALWRVGSLSDEMWQKRRSWARSFIALPLAAQVWEQEKLQHQYTDEFIAEIESGK